MARSFKLIFVCFLALFVMNRPALAELSPTKVYNCRGAEATTFDAACKAGLAQGGWDFLSIQGTVICNGNKPGTNEVTSFSCPAVIKCPPNSSGTTACVCDSGFKESGDQCVPINTADEKCRVAAMLYNSWENDNREGRVPGKLPIGEAVNVCVPSAEGSGGPPGCKHTFTGDMSFSMDGKTWETDGTSWAITEGAGLACVPGLDGDGSTNLPKPMEPDPPCKGQQGTVNGKDVCIDASSGETYGSDKKTNTDANGNTSTTTTEVLCKGEQCTVTTTNTPSSSNPGGGGGGGGSTTTTDMSRDQFCRQNPGSAVCRGTTDESGETRGQKPDGGGKGNGNGNGNGNGDGDGDDVTAPGTPGGELPKLWEKKYPNGVKGVWNARSSELKSSSLGGLATQLFPNVGDGGTPPSWTLDLDFGGVFNFGSFHLDLDSRVWLALKAFTIICALVLARRLVFGG